MGSLDIKLGSLLKLPNRYSFPKKPLLCHFKFIINFNNTQI